MLLTSSTGTILICFLIAPLTNIAQTQKSNQKLFDTIQLKKHIVTLASDSFQGRKPFTDGETRTIEYLTNELKTMDLEPGNGKTYLQDVTLVQSSFLSSFINVESSSGDFVLQNGKDYAIQTSAEDTVVSLQKIPVIFVGYGIVAPEYNRNDYAGADVKGKIVLVLLNEEDQKESFLIKDKPVTYYESVQYKLEEAARQGAIACFLVPAQNDSYPFHLIQPSMSQEKLDNFRDTNKISISGVLSRTALTRLFAASGLDSNILMHAV